MAKTTRIVVTSSLTVNLGNYNSGRIEMSIEKVLTGEESDEEIAKIKNDSWDEVNFEVDKQIRDLKDSLK